MKASANQEWQSVVGVVLIVVGGGVITAGPHRHDWSRLETETSAGVLVRTVLILHITRDC